MILRRIMGVALVLAVLFIFPVGVWVAVGANTVLSPATYISGLASQNIYEDIVPVALPALASQVEDNSGAPRELIESINAIQQAIGEDAWREVADLLVPPAWLQQQIEGSIDRLSAELEREDNTSNVMLFDLGEIQARVSGVEGDQAIQIILNAAPECTPEQEADFAVYETSSGDLPPICRKSDEADLETLRLALRRRFDRLADTLAVAMAEGGVEMQFTPEDFQQVRVIDALADNLLVIAFSCPMAIIGLIIATNVRSRKGFGRWIGVSAVIMGGITLLPVPFLQQIVNQAAANALAAPEFEPEVRIFLAQLATGIGDAIFAGFSVPVLVIGAVSLMIGFGLVVMASLGRGQGSGTLLLGADGQLYSVRDGQIVGTVTATPPPSPGQTPIVRRED
jgi:hypothetical protein